MRTFTFKVLVSSFALSGTACLADTAIDQGSQAMGAALLLPFKRDLKSALDSGLEEGPVSAISVCKVQAPAIAERLSIDGVEMGRASHRLRNPANQAPDWIDEILEEYLSGDAAFEPVATSLPNDRMGYAEPIIIQPLCLTCHGTSLAPDVAARVNEAYPEDEATGFEVGDLRGLYWVEYPQDMSSQQ